MDIKGLRWYKCDFHLHTMSSLCYKDRDTDTVDMWVNEVLKKKLQCIAITDHNDYRGIDDIKVKCEENGIVVFPGVELSCDSTKVHLLVIFNSSEDSNRVHEFLSQVGIFNPSLGISEKTCEGSIFEVCKKAHSMGALVIAAHIDEFNGLGDMSHDNIINILDREYLDAVQIVNDDIWSAHKNHIDWSKICLELSNKYGKDISVDLAKKWYKSYDLAEKTDLPFLSFSDNPYSDHEAKHGLWGIGNHFTWLKMDSTPDLESIRQALLSYDMRIKRCIDSKNSPDTYPSMWISELSYSNTTLNDSDSVVVKFNPQLNTIIGGRGSGKSSIIRLIAGGLGSFDADKLDSIKNEQDSFYKESKPDKNGVLTGVFTSKSEFSIEVVRNDDTYKIFVQNIKNMTEQIRKLYKFVDGEWQEISDPNFLDFFVAQIYTQKQIYEIAQDSNSLLNIIDQDISDISNLINNRDSILDNLIANQLEINNLKKVISEESKKESELKDIDDQIQKFEDSGISDALEEKQKFDAQQKIIDNYIYNKKTQIDQLSSAVDNFESNCKNVTLTDNLEINGLLNNDISVISNSIARVRNEINTIKQSTDLLNANINKSVWKSDKALSDTKYNTAVSQLESQGYSYEKLDDLLKNKNYKLKELDIIDEKKKELDLLITKEKELSDKYTETVLKITIARNKFIKSVIGFDSNVKFDIRSSKNRNSFIQMLKSVIGKDNYSINEGINQLTEIYFGDDGKNKYQKTIVELHNGIDSKDFNLYFKNAVLELQPEAFARMLFYLPDDDLIVSYKPENSKDFIPLSSASAGQKTTAILTFLLAYGSIPLLLDQPEDDLDNKLVYDLIVSRLKKAKSKRQIIVVTHNANIPVNADSEYIISMNSESDKVSIKYEGTMDDKSIREEICDVMEGTQFAFEMRAKKYHFRIVE